MLGALVLIGLCAGTESKNGIQEERDLSRANVIVVDGKYVFMKCTPSTPYESSFTYTTKVHSFGGCPSLMDMAEAGVKSAKEKGLPFDAVILGDTKTDLAIRFK